MLVFPDLGSQAEAAQNRPKDSERPWNFTIYSETADRSIYFWKLYVSLPSTLRKQVASAQWPAPSKTKPKFKIRILLITGH
jgi:hypothetical protein